MNAPRILIAGGGASGFFAAITAAEANPNAQVVLLEKGTHLLAKVGISGGGRCNVTHACFDPRELATRYPRGGRTLIGPLTRFGPTETIDWFQSRNVFLKTEYDGRIFPITDSSQTIIDCLTTAARQAGVKILTGTGVTSITNSPLVALFCTSLTAHSWSAIAFFGPPVDAGPSLIPPSSLGHTLTPPVPSLFTFHVDAPWLRELAGVSVESVEVSVPQTDLKECGPLLFTHSGLSGPAILRLSSWGARPLHELNYHFPLHLNWLPASSSADILREIQIRRETIGAQMVLRSRWSPLPLRLWEQLLLHTGITEEHRWSKLNRETALQIAQILTCTQILVTGKSMNKEEFVTSGGIPLNEVDFKTMESRLIPGLYFAGEALDIDGLTGGFNFQSAWTTGWIAGHAMASSSPPLIK